MCLAVWCGVSKLGRWFFGWTRSPFETDYVIMPSDSCRGYLWRPMHSTVETYIRYSVYLGNSNVHCKLWNTFILIQSRPNNPDIFSSHHFRPNLSFRDWMGACLGNRCLFVFTDASTTNSTAPPTLITTHQIDLILLDRISNAA